MNTYLTVITTVLVLTQIIRVTQNAIQLHRQNVLFERECKAVKDIDITEADIENQREAYRLIVEYLRK